MVSVKEDNGKTLPMLVVMVALNLVIGSPESYAGFPPTAAYPPASEDPVVDGAFSSSLEYDNANIVPDDLGVGEFYKQHRENWTVNGVTYGDTITYFDNHYFTDSAYGQLDMFDMNGWEFKWGNALVEAWVFLPGEHPDIDDWAWLDPSRIGAGNYPAGYPDDGGFLVRLNEDPTTDRVWHTGDPEPGDPGWNFADFYGVFAYGGFNDSSQTQGYGGVADDREIYEWSITLNRVPGTGLGGVDGAIPGVPQFGDGEGGADEDNPIAPPPCDPIWEEVTRFKKVRDWKPSMGGHGTFGGIGFVPDGTDWVLMGWDDSMHAKPAPGGGDVPTVSEWSLIVLTLFALTGGTIMFGRRWRGQHAAEA